MVTRASDANTRKERIGPAGRKAVVKMNSTISEAIPPAIAAKGKSQRTSRITVMPISLAFCSSPWLSNRLMVASVVGDTDMPKMEVGNDRLFAAL